MNIDLVLIHSAFAIMPTMKFADMLSAPLSDPARESQYPSAGLMVAIAKGDVQALGAFYDATVSRVLGPGDFHLARNGIAHGELSSPVGALFYRTGGRFKFRSIHT
jgi:hypothetical protein